MTTEERLREIERTVGFAYPPSFVSMFDDFSSLVGTASFRRAFPNAQLLLSVVEISTARASIPAALLPFMREEQTSWPDIYAFDIDSNGPEVRVVVWADHAIVMDWPSFPAFFQWVREHISEA